MESPGATQIQKKQIFVRKAIPIMVDGVEIIETIVDWDPNEIYEEIEEPEIDQEPPDSLIEEIIEPTHPNECPNCGYYSPKKMLRDKHTTSCSKALVKYRKMRQNRHAHCCDQCLYAAIDPRQLRIHLRKHTLGYKSLKKFIRLTYELEE